MSLNLAVLFGLLAVASATKPYLGFHLPSSSSIVQPRIVGGQEASPHEFPHQVSVQRGSASSLHHLCGGCILNYYWVLTVANCPMTVPGQTLHVKAGKHSLNAREESEQVIKVAKIFNHEKYPGGVAPYDISLLKLERPLWFGPTIQPIALPKQSAKVQCGVTLSGWGSANPNGRGTPDTLRKAHLRVVDLNTCKRAIEGIVGPTPLATSNVCTGAGISACMGDSGSPLIQNVRGKNEVIGVVSWIIRPCGTKGAPTVYTKVSYYIDWIQKIIAEN